MSTAHAPQAHETPEGSTTGRGHTPLMEQRAPDQPARSLPHQLATSGWLLALGWFFSRAWMFHQWVRHYTFITGDPRYYNWQLSQPGIRTQLREYPVPVVWVLQFVHWCASGHENYYIGSFAVLMALLDLGFTLLLWQQAHRRAAWYWTLFTTCMGSLLWYRFDVLPAVIVGAALLLMIRNPRTSGVLVAIGTAIKLWPAMVLLPLLSRDRDGRRRLLGFLGCGVVVGAISLAQAGSTRLVSPLTWQSDRGLQVESVTGSLLVLLDSRSVGRQWSIHLSSYHAFEIFGPHVSTMMHVSSILTLAAGLLALALGVRTWLRGSDLDPYLASMATVAVIAAFIVANKTFSPQYMFWLGAPIAVLLSCAGTRGRRFRAIALGVMGLVTALLTQYVYPQHYNQLIFGGHPQRTIAMVLVVRNLLCVLITLWAAACALFGRSATRTGTTTVATSEATTPKSAPGTTPLDELPIIVFPSSTTPTAPAGTVEAPETAETAPATGGSTADAPGGTARQAPDAADPSAAWPPPADD